MEIPSNQLIRVSYAGIILIAILASGCSHKTSSDITSEFATPPSTNQPTSTSTGLAAVQEQLTQAQRNNRLDKLANTVTICSVNDTPLTMADYRKDFKQEQEQVQASLAVNSEIKDDLLTIAKQRSISLTPAEKTKLIKSAHSGGTAGSSAFVKVLKENNISQSEFDSQVLEMGLAYKASSSLIEERILKEMIDRELLASAAKTAGFSKQAIAEYIKIKESPQFKKNLQSSGLTDEAAQSAIVKNQLCKLMIKKIQDSDTVTDKEVKQFYDDNKTRLKHGARIRFSQIVISFPQEDTQASPSLRTRLRKANPKMKDSELDKTIKLLENEQRQRAENLLGQAKRGEDFAMLANLNTQDASAHQAKNGGDMGFQDTSDLSKVLSSKISSLKVGQVCPELIQSPYGFHIIKVTAKEPAGTLSFAECEDRIKQLLSEQKAQQSLSKWFDEQLRTAKISLSPEFQALISLATTDKTSTTQR